MKPGVTRQLAAAEIDRLAAGRPELDGKTDLVAFAYIDLSAAQRYADRNREHGYTVIGPIQPGKGGSWANVIVLEDIAAGRRQAAS